MKKEKGKRVTIQVQGLQVIKIKEFEEIQAWQLARELTKKVYNLTKKPKFSDDYGIKKQIRAATGSSMHNIAEGFDSESNRVHISE